MNENYRTNNLNLATFLCIKGFQLLNIENETKRKAFIFEPSDQLNEMVRIFNFGEPNDPVLMVNAQKILQVFRELKTKLYNNNYTTSPEEVKNIKKDK